MTNTDEMTVDQHIRKAERLMHPIQRYYDGYPAELVDPNENEIAQASVHAQLALVKLLREAQA